MKTNGDRITRYSIKRQLLFGSITLFLLFAILLISGSAYYASVIRTQIYTSMKEMLDLYKNNMENEFTSSEKYLFGMIHNNTDITVLDENHLDTNFYISITNIQQSLQNILPCFSSIDGLFVYSVRTDTFISYYKNTNNSSCNYYLRNMFQQNRSKNSMAKINIARWHMVNYENTNYFIRIIQVGNSYVGAWANSKSLLSALNTVKGFNEHTMFLSDDGRVIGENAFSGMEFHPADSLDGYQMVQDAGGTVYLMITDRVDYIGCYLVTLISNKFLLNKLSNSRIGLLIVGVMVLLLGIFLTLWLNRYFTKPLKLLLGAIKSLRAGEFDTKIHSGKVQCEEFIQVNNAFNDMVDRIHKLKIDVYEEKLEHKQFELKYLKSQIAPHFLINCLNIIYYLSSDQQNHDTIRKLTVILSDHLRYTLADRFRVRLSDEMKYATNYLELSNILFPGCMHFEIEVDPRTEDASIFPLMVLMFFENSVKHELIMGEELHVRAKTRLIEEESGDRIHLTIVDSGDGFPKEFLDAVKQQAYTPHNENGNHIGIENIIRRLKMVYNENASIVFSNEPDAGARIDIYIPYEIYQPEDHITGDKMSKGNADEYPRSR